MQPVWDFKCYLNLEPQSIEKQPKFWTITFKIHTIKQLDTLFPFDHRTSLIFGFQLKNFLRDIIDIILIQIVILELNDHIFLGHNNIVQSYKVCCVLKLQFSMYVTSFSVFHTTEATVSIGLKHVLRMATSILQN